MAVPAYISQLLNTLPSEQKRVLLPAFEYVLGNFRLSDGPRAANFQWYQLEGVTSSVAGTEFSIAHGLDQAPRWLIPVLDLKTVGAQMVPLTVTRLPDVTRIYLSSTSTSATFRVYLEPA